MYEQQQQQQQQQLSRVYFLYFTYGGRLKATIVPSCAPFSHVFKVKSWISILGAKAGWTAGKTLLCDYYVSPNRSTSKNWNVTGRRCVNDCHRREFRDRYTRLTPVSVLWRLEARYKDCSFVEDLDYIGVNPES